MKKLLLALLAVACGTAYAQAPKLIRGTIAGLEGDVLSVKARDGKDLKIRLAPDAAVVVPKETTLAEFKPGSYVGVTSLRRPDGRLLAKRVHALGPAVPSGHMDWDSIPHSKMTNANISGIVQVSGGNELTLKYKDGEQKILVDHDTKYYTFAPASRADLKPGATIFTGAKMEGEGRYSTGRVVVSKDGIAPPQ